MVSVLLFVCRLALRVFFRQLEVRGSKQVPEGEMVMFALNHPNGLVDPLFILCYAGRPVSFLAKAPLFTMPVVGYFVRAFRCLPVYRRQDNNDPSQNRAMLRRAVELLSEGNALALFPEGTSHSDPRLKPFRSGAARIALSAAALANDTVKLVPVGLYYSRKQVFRSNALMLFGKPLVVAGAGLGVDAEPPQHLVQEVTHELSRRIGELTLQAATSDTIYLAKIAERIVVAANQADGLPVPDNMADKLDFRRRLLEGHARLEDREDVTRLVARIRAYEASVRALRLRVDQVFDHAPATVLGYLLRTLVWAAILVGPGLLRIATNYLTYRLVGWLAFRYAKQDLDIQATGKMLGGLLLFPLTWALYAVVGGLLGGPVVGLVVLFAVPAGAYMALLLVELISGLVRRGKSLWLALTQRGCVEQLVAERRAIRDELMRVAELLEARASLAEANAPLPSRHGT